MCALLIVMIIIIAVSGIIVFVEILIVKYFIEEDDDKIGPVFERLAMWKLHKDNELVEPNELKCTITGKDVSNVLDAIFIYGSYVVMVIITI